MPPGRVTSLSVTLTYRQRQTLEAWLRTYTLPAAQVRRARLIPPVAEGLPLSQAARRVGICRRFVYKWVALFQAQGCAGLVDLPKNDLSQRRRMAAAP